ncbi:DUF3180 domain-containing protein [Pseudonocardia sp.]|jgi:hypothetical protein|uniref:DUF3180 domain-containing protein n=1 Tax=Pseudonocardia sp. TaxID=60912 RepID=UPI002D94ADED|nr:DUF3180 domain-containing protein [Pseudonocardia sp.]
MTLTRPRHLLAVALVTALVVNLAVRLTYNSLPPLPLPAGATFGVLGLAEVVAGNLLRARIRRRPGTQPVRPLVAARAVLVAKASSLAGAVMAGVWGGLLAHVLPRAADVAAAASDALAAGVGLACALVLVGGALWLEWCCRTPDDESDEKLGE